jgi:hypothetical protein
MPAISVAGAAFTVDVASVGYESQVTSGTITTTPTIVRTKTLDSVAFDQTDLNSTISIEFLYDENTGLYDALQVAIAGAQTVAVDVRSAVGHWAGNGMSIESAEMTVEAAGIATCSVSFTGTVSFS